MEHDLRNVISSKKCSKCGGPADGWKCSECGKTSDHFDPTHWRECDRGGKMKVKCKGCQEAEDNCTCKPQVV